MSRSERALAGGSLFLLQMGVRMLTPFVVAPLLVRHAGAEALGAYAVIVQIAAYVLIVDLGVSQALSRAIAQLDIHLDAGRISRFIMSGGLFLTAAGLLAGLLTAVLAVTLPLWLEGKSSTINEGVNAIYLLGFWYVFRLPLSLFQTYLFARQQIARTAFSSLASDLITTVLQVAFTLAGMSIMGLVGATILAEAFAAGYCAWYAWPEWQRLPWVFKPDSKSVKELFRIGVPLSVIGLADRFVFSSQNIIAGIIFNTRTVASFYASRLPAYSFASILWRVSDPVVPAFNELYGKKMSRELEQTFTRIAGYKLGLALWGAVMVIIFNKPFVHAWMGPEYYIGPLMTVSVALYIPISSINNIFRKLVIVEGRLGYYTGIILAESILSVALAFWLGAVLGTPGIVIAVCLTQFVSITYSFLQVNKIFLEKPSELAATITGFALRTSAAGTVTCLLYTFIQGYLESSHWFEAALVLSVMALAGFIFWGMTSGDRKNSFNFIRKIILRS